MGHFKYIKKDKDSLFNTLKNKTQEMGFADEKLADVLEYEKVFVVENYNRYPIKIIYDGEKIYVLQVYESPEINKDKMLETFNARYIRGAAKIIQLFEKLPFIMFGEYIPEKPNDAFVIYDIWINDNWVTHKDLTQIVTNNGFRCPRVVFYGLYNEEQIKKTIKLCQSEVRSGYIDYCFVKPEVEMTFGCRGNRMAGIISTYVVKPSEKKKETKKSKEKAIEVMGNYLEVLIDSTVIHEWQEFLEAETIFPLKENKEKILSSLVKHSLKDMQVDIFQLSESHNLEASLIEDAVKKLLPKYIIKAFKLK